MAEYVSKRGTYQFRQDINKPTLRQEKTAKGEWGKFEKPSKKKMTRQSPNFRDKMYSIFLVTVNTNQKFKNAIEADVANDKLVVAVDALTEGDICDTALFFKVSVGRGSRWKRDNKNKIILPREQSPDFDSEWNSAYLGDDVNFDTWCSLMESIWIKGGTEFAPKTGYLHAHIIMKVEHRTRLQVNTEEIAAHFRQQLNLPHKPYVNIHVINFAERILENYITKSVIKPKEIEEKSEKWIVDKGKELIKEGQVYQ